VWDWFEGELGRPLVLGFENGATAFSISLGLLVLTFITSKPDLHSENGLLTTALISISTMVFAASMVRFTLLAILAILAACFVVSVRDRKLCLTLGMVISASVAVGLLARPASTAVYMTYAMDGLTGSHSGDFAPESRESAEAPAALKQFELPDLDYCRSANTRNSLEIRKVLLIDSIRLAPAAGPFGFGLNSFAALGCFKGYSPHNDVLQAIVEFGWLGAASFVALIALPLILLFGPARTDPEIRFVFLLCAYLIMLSMIYGRINGEIVLFMALGLAGSLVSARGALERRSWGGVP
jgi:O-antigen ligase